MPLQIPVTQVGLEQSIQQAMKNAAKNSTVNLGTNSRQINALAQPLGRITGQADEFTKSMEAANARVFAFGASVGVINAVSKAFMGMVKSTIAVEKSLVDINVNLNQSSTALEKFGNKLFDTAKNTGQSFETVSKAALELSRQGLDSAQVVSRLNDAMILTRLSGLDAADAVSGLTAAFNSYKDTGITTTQIVDKLVAVSQKYAVSERDLIEGLKRSASVADLAGVSFDELIATLTATQEITARGGSVLGNAYKTIFSKINDKGVLKDLQDLGVAVTDSSGKVLSATQLIENLSKQFQSLDQTKQLDIAKKIAGGFQLSNLLALFKDLNATASKYPKMLKTSLDANGESTAKNILLNQTLDSILNKVSLSAEQLGATLGKIGMTDSLKNVLGFFNGILETVQEILGEQSAMGTLFRGLAKGIGNVFAGPGLALFGAIILKLSKDLVQFGFTSLKAFFGIGKASKEIADVEKSIAQVLARNVGIQQQLFQLEGNRAAQLKLITDALIQQEAVLRRSSGIASSLAPALYGVGGRATGTGLRLNPPTAAAGYMPPVAKEASDISKGVGGARSGDKPVVIPNFSFGGGKKGTIVAHTGEYAVPNFGGSGGTAIFNRQMVQTMGLPSGAKKITASGGFVPNFAITGLAAKDFDKEGAGEYKILAGRIFEALLRNEKRINLTENIVGPDITNGKWAIAEAKLSGNAAFRDPEFGEGKLKGANLVLPSDSSRDFDDKLVLYKKAKIERSNISLKRLFGIARNIIDKERLNKQTDISNILIPSKAEGFIPNFARISFTGEKGSVKGTDVQIARSIIDAYEGGTKLKGTPVTEAQYNEALAFRANTSTAQETIQQTRAEKSGRAQSLPVINEALKYGLLVARKNIKPDMKEMFASADKNITASLQPKSAFKIVFPYAGITDDRFDSEAFEQKKAIEEARESLSLSGKPFSEAEVQKYAQELISTGSAAAFAGSSMEQRLRYAAGIPLQKMGQRIDLPLNSKLRSFTSGFPASVKDVEIKNSLSPDNLKSMAEKLFDVDEITKNIVTAATITPEAINKGSLKIAKTAKVKLTQDQIDAQFAPSKGISSPLYIDNDILKNLGDNREALVRIASESPNYTLVAGPPGVGKSTYVERNLAAQAATSESQIKEAIKKGLPIYDVRASAEGIAALANSGLAKKAILLKASQAELELSRNSRSQTGAKLFGRSTEETKNAYTSTDDLEALLSQRFGGNLSVYNRVGSSWSQINPSEYAKSEMRNIAVTRGAFAPFTVGHAELVKNALEAGYDPEDVFVSVSRGVSSNFNPKNPHSARTMIYNREFRLAMAQAALKGTIPSENVFLGRRGSIAPYAINKGAGFVVPNIKKSTGFVGEDKEVEKTRKDFLTGGYGSLSQGARTSGISGTAARAAIDEALDTSNFSKLKGIVSPAVLALLEKNKSIIKNRRAALFGGKANNAKDLAELELAHPELYKFNFAKGFVPNFVDQEYVLNTLKRIKEGTSGFSKQEQEMFLKKFGGSTNVGGKGISLRQVFDTLDSEIGISSLIDKAYMAAGPTASTEQVFQTFSKQIAANPNALRSLVKGKGFVPNFAIPQYRPWEDRSSPSANRINKLFEKYPKTSFIGSGAESFAFKLDSRDTIAKLPTFFYANQAEVRKKAQTVKSFPWIEAAARIKQYSDRLSLIPVKQKGALSLQRYAGPVIDKILRDPKKAANLIHLITNEFASIKQKDTKEPRILKAIGLDPSPGNFTFASGQWAGKTQAYNSPEYSANDIFAENKFGMIDVILHSNLLKQELKTRASKGFVPNFANPLSAAIGRELSAGVPASQIYVDKNPSLKTAANPMGLMVANRRDEPMGGHQGISRAIKEGRNPKTYGAAEGFVPNYAKKGRYGNRSTNATTQPNPTGTNQEPVVIQNNRQSFEQVASKMLILTTVTEGLSGVFSEMGGKAEAIGTALSKAISTIYTYQTLMGFLNKEVAKNSALTKLSNAFKQGKEAGPAGIANLRASIQGRTDIGSFKKFFQSKAAGAGAVAAGIGGAEGVGAAASRLGPYALAAYGIVKGTQIIGDLYKDLTRTDLSASFDRLSKAADEAASSLGAIEQESVKMAISSGQSSKFDIGQIWSETWSVGLNEIQTLVDEAGNKINFSATGQKEEKISEVFDNLTKAFAGAATTSVAPEKLGKYAQGEAIAFMKRVAGSSGNLDFNNPETLKMIISKVDELNEESKKFAKDRALAEALKHADTNTKMAITNIDHFKTALGDTVQFINKLDDSIFKLKSSSLVLQAIGDISVENNKNFSESEKAVAKFQNSLAKLNLDNYIEDQNASLDLIKSLKDKTAKAIEDVSNNPGSNILPWLQQVQDVIQSGDLDKIKTFLETADRQKLTGFGIKSDEVVEQALAFKEASVKRSQDFKTNQLNAVLDAKRTLEAQKLSSELDIQKKNLDLQMSQQEKGLQLAEKRQDIESRIKDTIFERSLIGKNELQKINAQIANAPDVLARKQQQSIVAFKQESLGELKGYSSLIPTNLSSQKQFELQKSLFDKSQVIAGKTTPEEIDKATTEAINAFSQELNKAISDDSSARQKDLDNIGNALFEISSETVNFGNVVSTSINNLREVIKDIPKAFNELQKKPLQDNLDEVNKKIETTRSNYDAQLKIYNGIAGALADPNTPPEQIQILNKSGEESQKYMDALGRSLTELTSEQQKLTKELAKFNSPPNSIQPPPNPPKQQEPATTPPTPIVFPDRTGESLKEAQETIKALGEENKTLTAQLQQQKTEMTDANYIFEKKVESQKLGIPSTIADLQAQVKSSISGEEINKILYDLETQNQLGQTQTPEEFYNKLRDRQNKSTSQLFTEKFSKTEVEKSLALKTTLVDASVEFKNNLIDGINQSIQQGQSLGEVLRSAALSFAQTMTKAAMSNVVDSFIGSSKNGSSGVLGSIFGYASGGMISGGSGSRDDVPAMLMGGEYVINKNAVKKYGPQFLNAINQGSLGGFAKGGHLKTQTGAGGYYIPGTNNLGAIKGGGNLLSFATQTNTSGQFDKIINRGNFASINLETESGRLTTMGMRNSPMFDALQSSKEEAFGLYSQEYQQIKDLKKQSKAQNKALRNQLIMLAATTALSVGAGAAGTGFKNAYAASVNKGGARIWDATKGIWSGGDIGSGIMGGGLKNLFSGNFGLANQTSIPKASIVNNAGTNSAANINGRFIATAYGEASIDPTTALDQLKANKGLIKGGFSQTIGASGRKLIPGFSVASNYFPLGAILNINGKEYRVDDRGGMSNNVIDFFAGEKKYMYDRFANMGTLNVSRVRATGGSIPSASGVDTVSTMLSGGEFIMNRAATQNIGAGNLQALNSGAKSLPTEEKSEELNDKLIAKLDELIEASGSNSGAITINVSGQGKSATETSGKTNDSQEQLARQIKDAVLKVINDEKRLGGQLRRR